MSTVINTGEEAPPATVAPRGIPEHCKRARRGFRCIMCVLIINFLLMIMVAHKVCSIWWALSPDSDMILMPGGTRPFCSDMCLQLCAPQDPTVTPLGCNVLHCVDSCQNYFIQDGLSSEGADTSIETITTGTPGVSSTQGTFEFEIDIEVQQETRSSP